MLAAVRSDGSLLLHEDSLLEEVSAFSGEDVQVLVLALALPEMPHSGGCGPEASEQLGHWGQETGSSRAVFELPWNSDTGISCVLRGETLWSDAGV